MEHATLPVEGTILRFQKEYSIIVNKGTNIGILCDRLTRQENLIAALYSVHFDKQHLLYVSSSFNGFETWGSQVQYFEILLQPYTIYENVIVSTVGFP